MKHHRLMRVFTDRYPLIGPLLWVLSIQYYVVQVIVAAGWQTPFSWLHNTISDLGNTACGAYGSRLVCSPSHDLMNTSFITLGITMMAGSALMYQEFKPSLRSFLGFVGMGLAGLGTLLVGVFPENTISSLHVLGAALPFVIGNIALLLLAWSLRLPTWLTIYTVASGVIALLALVLFYDHRYLGLDIGGMERIVAYPQTIWLMFFGLYMSRNRFRRRS